MQQTTRLIPLALALLAAPMLAAPLLAADEPRSEVVAADDIQWGYLNPLRGKLSPGAADLWGDRTTDSATGMLVRFNKGFASPPHIHNITYRGVVIEGLMHNDDPDARRMWMPKGSFWTQPAGEDHITAANAEHNLIYLEIDSGPYLVQPSSEQFDNGERPLNLHANNLVWVDQAQRPELDAEGTALAELWGDPSPGAMGGTLIRLPAGFQGRLVADAEEFRAVVIQGSLSYRSAERDGASALGAGSYFGSRGAFEHQLASEQGGLIYLRTDGTYRLSSN
ncbi:DUF4437 domain-containing protein [Ferrimonas balearica]|uniref:DUF4437 domain-containing protein n=1 Tax=Ferrimonas balearica TaxID=44012 RepID=UPI001C99F799|nr:DUF4437 domain-containing protein [Ferrimonas balearica]MBY5992343.1 DUF4437 domain-containing protein [Ferrimonas balearica]